MVRKLRCGRLAPLALLIILLCGCSPAAGGGPTDTPPPGAAPSGDYGDAPDGGATGYPAPFAQNGRFPTTFASNGARTLRVDEATLGPAASAEVDATDPADPDGVQNLTNADLDDGLTDFFITLTAIPPATTLSVNVSGPAGSAGGTFYINALIDLNMDGEWGGRGANGELEWAVQNQQVQVVPGSTTPFTSPPFAFSNGNLLPDGAYMRLALTKEMVPANWDGTGEFSSGEIEDHVIRLPDLGGKKPPILTVDCGGPYAPGAMVTCTVNNHRNVAGNFTYSLGKVAGGTVVVPIATCAPGGPAGGPVAIAANGAVAITCASTPGTTPTTWRFTAKVQDPGAVVVDGGIQLGHSDESAADFDFEGDPKTLNVFVAGLLGYYQHFQGFSMVISHLLVHGSDPIPMEGAQVTLQITHPDGSTETQAVTTGPDGRATAEFTIFVYGNYVVSVEGIEGDFMAYDPTQNVADSLELAVVAAETAPVGVYPIDPEITAFVEEYNRAFEAGDVDALLATLHPAVTELYGAEACRAYVEGVTGNPIHLDPLGVKTFGTWLWEVDGISREVEQVYTVLVNLTVQGQTKRSEVHLGRREDGSVNWFTDCGDPLPES